MKIVNLELISVILASNFVFFNVVVVSAQYTCHCSSGLAGSKTCSKNWRVDSGTSSSRLPFVSEKNAWIISTPTTILWPLAKLTTSDLSSSRMVLCLNGNLKQNQYLFWSKNNLNFGLKKDMRGKSMTLNQKIWGLEMRFGRNNK